MKANFGTMTKPLHVGQCTEWPVRSAPRARRLTANPGVFEHKQGFFKVFNDVTNYDAGKVLPDWGKPFES